MLQFSCNRVKCRNKVSDRCQGQQLGLIQQGQKVRLISAVRYTASNSDVFHLTNWRDTERLYPVNVASIYPSGDAWKKILNKTVREIRLVVPLYRHIVLVKTRCRSSGVFGSEEGDVTRNILLWTWANIVCGLNFVLGRLREEGNTELR